MIGRIVVLASLCAALIFCASPARADDWSSADKSLAAAAVMLTVVDWAQTRYIARHGGTFHEMNPIIGAHPSMGRVNSYFAAALGTGAVLASTLPPHERRWFLGGAAVVEFSVTARNAAIGIRMDF